MSDAKLTIFINNEAIYDCERVAFHDEDKLKFLDKMDLDMNKGIKIDGQLIENPDIEHRFKFVVMNLIRAFQHEDEAKISVTIGYLTQRRPALIEIRITNKDGPLVIEFIDKLDD